MYLSISIHIYYIPTYRSGRQYVNINTEKFCFLWLKPNIEQFIYLNFFHIQIQSTYTHYDIIKQHFFAFFKGSATKLFQVLRYKRDLSFR